MPAVPASGPSPVPLPSPFAGGSEEAHFQQVFRDFVATKEKCGEPADGLTYEKFAAKLLKNQEQLIAKYACRSVRFQVYVEGEMVKDGAQGPTGEVAIGGSGLEIRRAAKRCSAYSERSPLRNRSLPCAWPAGNATSVGAVPGRKGSLRA